MLAAERLRGAPCPLLSTSYHARLQQWVAHWTKMTVMVDVRVPIKITGP